MTASDRTTANLLTQAQGIAERALGKGQAADDMAAEIVALAQASGGPYAAALDEVYALRGVCAATALEVGADLDYKSFPKTRRGPAEARVERLKEAARGRAQVVTAGMYLKPIFVHVGAPVGLTRASFEASLPTR